MTGRTATPARRAPRALAGRAGAALAAVGALAVTAAVVLFAYSLLAGGEDDRSSAAGPPPSVVPRELRSERLGVALQFPASWQRRPGKRYLRLVSGDGSMAMSLAVAPPTLSRVEVRSEAVAQLRGAYDDVRVLRRSERVIGSGLKALTAEVVGRRRSDGTPIRALVASVRSSWRTYAVTVFSQASPPRARAVEAALMLRSLTLSRPRA